MSMAHLQSSDHPCPQCRVRREEERRGERESEGGRARWREKEGERE